MTCMAHEGRQAFYRLTSENGKLTLTAKVELPDALDCLETEEFCSTEQDRNWCVANWINEHLNVTADGKPLTFELESTIIEAGHLIIHYVSNDDLFEVNDQITIWNDAFLSTFEDYENIVQISIASSIEGYKLNRTRTTINHVL